MATGSPRPLHRDDLRAWLARAGVHERALDQMVSRLEQEDVYEPADLHDLRQTSRFTAVFSELYQLRINRRLDAEMGAGSA
eukprot:275598-Prymnesium_polylepis.1